MVTGKLLMTPEYGEPSSWYAAISATIGATVSAVAWWFHVRKIARADKVDGSVTKSISFVLDALRSEIAANHSTIMELRARIMALEAQNEELRAKHD